MSRLKNTSRNNSCSYALLIHGPVLLAERQFDQLVYYVRLEEGGHVQSGAAQVLGHPRRRRHRRL